ncbi:hypothetical protein MNBD_BACTEROID05-1051 [hydrothermal vent metagenome]|uniref:Polymerase nucleotidyl transferase domain-containing protein n=1 Tax=hydrothermal vent metagenome TaxID=652676 RepID=A0A3B0TEI1_9ZZZZ
MIKIAKNIIPKQKIVIRYLKKQGVLKAGVFGSFSRGEQKKRSDVDILVKVKRGTSLLDLIGYERELEEIMGYKVDLITYNQIHPLLKEQILNDEVSLL